MPYFHPNTHNNQTLNNTHRHTHPHTSTHLTHTPHIHHSHTPHTYTHPYLSFILVRQEKTCSNCLQYKRQVLTSQQGQGYTSTPLLKLELWIHLSYTIYTLNQTQTHTPHTHTTHTPTTHTPLTNIPPLHTNTS